MPDAFVDTSVIIRLVTGDDPRRQAKSKALFERAQRGEMRLFVPATVVTEAVYVLCSPRLYSLSRADTAEILATLLTQDGIDVEHGPRVLRALSIFGTANVDFDDALIVAAMEAAEATNLYSYDRDYDRFDGITRLEP